jgi:hypothetical protein
MSEWTYNNKPFDSDMIEDYVGFVYEVYDTEAKMKYIGKKKFWSKVTRPPLKGKKNKRRSVKESDWKSYYGSSEEVKQLVENTGEWRFKRKIIRLCKSLGEMSYYEMKEQIDRDVLLKPEEYYNAFVGGKIHRRHLGHLINKK